MLEEQEDPFTHILGVELIMFVCPQIHSTDATTEDISVMDLCMEQSMKLLYKGQMTVLFPVLCV